MAVLVGVGLSIGCAPVSAGRGERGRVVDAATHAGMPGAFVVAVWRADTAGIAGMMSSSSTCLAQTVATTDDDGRFELAAPVLPHASLGTTRERLLVVFKPGYVRGNDLDVLPQHEQRLFTWQFYPPESGEGATGRVDLRRIELQPAALPAPDSWVYTDAVLRTARCEDRLGASRNTPEFDRFEQSLRAPLRVSPCALDPATPVSPHAHASFGWALNDQKYLDTMKVLEHFGPNEFKGTTAGTMCRALNEEKRE